jgi:hypothetical protein
MSAFSFFLHSRRALPAVLATLIFALLLLGAFSSPVTHAASGTASFGLQPVGYDTSNPLSRSYFIFNARAGATVHSLIRVTNTGTAAGSALLYPVDATTGQTSGTVYRPRDAARIDVANWLTLGLSQVSLAPGQSQVVPFQFVVPSVVRSGQHLGGIVAESMTQQHSSPKEKLQVTIQHLTIMAVQVNLPGLAVDQLTATGIQAGGAQGYQNLLLGLSNTGTMMLLKTYGSLQITNAQGQILQNLPLRLGTFLPQSSINYPVYVQKKALGVGVYQASLNLIYGHNQLLHSTFKFTITQQQLANVFTSNGPLQAPGNGGLLNLLTWQNIVIALFLIGAALYFGRKFYLRLATASR